jgi:hypothetical protein
LGTAPEASCWSMAVWADMLVFDGFFPSLFGMMSIAFVVALDLAGKCSISHTTKYKAGVESRISRAEGRRALEVIQGA